jgi:hypothetical protein
MPRGEKSGNPRMKRHRASRIAADMMRQGVPRATANRMAAAAMEREYARTAGSSAEEISTDEGAHDPRTGSRKTRLRVRRPAEAGAARPHAARRGRAAKHGARKPRAGGARSAAARRAPVPRKAAGYRPPRGRSAANRSRQSGQTFAKRVPRSTGPGGAGTSRKGPMSGRAATGKKSSGVSRVAT